MQKILSLTVSALIFLTSSALADGYARDSVPPSPEATPNQASDASFDSRLPPVLPGEEVNDSGQKMKVWSTAGPIPVSRAPEPFNDGSSAREILGGSKIVIDRRLGTTNNRGNQPK